MVTLLTVAAALAVDDGWVDDAIRFRRSVGLESERGFVASTFTRDGYSADDYGVPLSDAEVQTLNDRQARLEKANPGHEWAYEQPSFAGSWIDQSRDGLIVYQFSESVGAAEQKLDDLLPAGVKYAVRRVERSLDTLRQLQSRISKDIESLDADGIEVVSVGLDIRDNTVVVGIAGDATGKRAIIKDRYGEPVKVATEDTGHADACNGLRDCAPLKGGIKVYDVPGPAVCTAGYIAKRPDGRFVLVTAGHCIKIGDHGNDWKHESGGPVLGTSDEYHSIWCCTNSGNEGADVGYFVIDVDQVPSVNLRAIVNHADPTVDEIRADLPDCE